MDISINVHVPRNGEIEVRCERNYSVIRFKAVRAYPDVTLFTEMDLDAVAEFSAALRKAADAMSSKVGTHTIIPIGAPTVAEPEPAEQPEPEMVLS